MTLRSLLSKTQPLSWAEYVGVGLIKTDRHISLSSCLHCFEAEDSGCKCACIANRNFLIKTILLESKINIIKIASWTQTSGRLFGRQPMLMQSSDSKVFCVFGFSFFSPVFNGQFPALWWLSILTLLLTKGGRSRNVLPLIQPLLMWWWATRC